MVLLVELVEVCQVPVPLIALEAFLDKAVQAYHEPQHQRPAAAANGQPPALAEASDAQDGQYAVAHTPRELKVVLAEVVHLELSLRPEQMPLAGIHLYEV